MTGSVTSSEILIFSNLKLHSSILVSKSVSSLFRVFMFLRTRCAKLKMRELIIQVFPTGGYEGSPPISQKSAQTSLPANIPPVDHQHHPYSFTRKVNFPPLNKVA